MEDVTITKEVNVDLTIDFVRCTECGKDAEFDVSIDQYQNIEIEFYPHKCD